jgi:hypothetical protein
MKNILKIALFVIILLTAMRGFGQEICIPEQTVDQIILTLHDYEVVKIKYNEADSTLQVYGKELKHREAVILEQKVTLDQFNQLVTDLQMQVTIKNDKIHEARKRIRKLVASHVIRTIIEIGVIVLIIAL